MVWQDYYASPSAQFHVEELLFTACHYRLRYAYDYTVQFDIDEFWALGPKGDAKTLPEFLDQHMSKDAASIGFLQVQHCQRLLRKIEWSSSMPLTHIAATLEFKDLVR